MLQRSRLVIAFPVVTFFVSAQAAGAADGAHVANHELHSIWLLDLTAAHNPARRLSCSDGGAAYGRWAPRGRDIYFLPERCGKQQIWKTDLSGKAAIQVTDLPTEMGKWYVGLSRQRGSLLSG
jgi:Tol biopolymer transport system component